MIPACVREAFPAELPHTTQHRQNQLHNSEPVLAGWPRVASNSLNDNTNNKNAGFIQTPKFRAAVIGPGCISHGFAVCVLSVEALTNRLRTDLEPPVKGNPPKGWAKTKQLKPKRWQMITKSSNSRKQHSPAQENRDMQQMLVCN